MKCICFGPIYLIFILMLAKYTKLDAISRSNAVKYSDLVTSRVEKSIQEVW